METINCYARLGDFCLNGKPLTAEGDPDYMMEDDGTYIGQIHAVCCTQCYAACGAPILADLTLAIMKHKGCTVVEEEVDAQDLEPGDLWYWAHTEWAPGTVGNKINLAVRTGNVNDTPGRVYRIRITKDDT